MHLTRKNLYTLHKFPPPLPIYTFLYTVLMDIDKNIYTKLTLFIYLQNVKLLKTKLSLCVMLLFFRNPLVKAVVHMCRAMQTSVLGKTESSQNAFSQCEKASTFLRNSLNMSGTCNNDLNKVNYTSCILLH